VVACRHLPDGMLCLTAVNFSADGPFVLQRYPFLRSTPIWIHTYSTHNSSRHWEQPECFRPERFLQPGAEYAASTPKSAIAEGQAGIAQAVTAAGNASSSSGRALTSTQPLKFYPFSQGQRDCIGQSLARMDYLALLAVLLGSYRFVLAGQVSTQPLPDSRPCARQLILPPAGCILPCAGGSARWSARHHQPDAAARAWPAGSSSAASPVMIAGLHSRREWRRKPIYLLITLAATFHSAFVNKRLFIGL
jgi:hypothetical protein